MFNLFNKVSDKSLLKLLEPEKGISFFGGKYKITKLTHTEENKIYHFELAFNVHKVEEGASEASEEVINSAVINFSLPKHANKKLVKDKVDQIVAITLATFDYRKELKIEGVTIKVSK